MHRLLVPLLLAAPASALAQGTPAGGGAPAGAAFVVMLGADTVAVERFTRTAARLEGERVVRFPRTSVTHYVATLAPDGSIVRFESSTRPGSGLDRPPARTASIEIGADTSVVTVRSGDSTHTSRILTRRLATPIIGFSYALYEQVLRHAVATGQDSVAVDLISSASPNPIETWVRRTAADSAVIGFVGEPARAHIGPDGAIRELRGVQTTRALVVTRTDTADIEALARDFASREPR